MFKKILVPLDGSSLAEYALDPAIALAKQVKGEVVLCEVTSPMITMVPAYLEEERWWSEGDITRAYDDAKIYLHSICKRYAHPNIQMWCVVEGGNPAQVILQLAEKEGIDLIVMSTHGRSGLSRWLMGSVTEKVLQHASCPVLVVRSDTPLQRFLIPLDGSELSEMALLPGLEVAHQLGGEVTLMTVQQEVMVKTSDYMMARQLEHLEHGLGGMVIDALEQKMHTYLTNVKETHSVLRQYNDVPIDLAVEEGEPAERILQYAEAHEIDVIVMATHGRTGLKQWIYGSVTNKVLKQAQSAMLIVR